MIADLFPRLRGSGYRVTSPATAEYNCIAWAAEDTESWWWPDRLRQYFWPPGIPRNESIEAFVALFESFGYEVCDDADQEVGFEKIAIYIDSNDKVTHASRQLESGAWTSKVGRLEDIEHALDGVSGSRYGSAAVIMRRPKRQSPQSA